MIKLVLHSIVIIFLGTTAALLSTATSNGAQPIVSLNMNGDAAFRDGLYLGGLDARNGRALHPASGRWSTEKDRGSFLAGYLTAYRQRLSRGYM